MQTKFVEANGLRFEVLEEGTGDRLALCLHGFPEHAISWRHQIPVLAGMRYRVWAVNRGPDRIMREVCRLSAASDEPMAAALPAQPPLPHLVMPAHHAGQ